MPDRDPLTGVPPSRHPFQFWALFACVVSGVSTVSNVGQPGTLVEVMPAYMVVLWGWNLMVSGALGIVAGWWPDRITGLLLERIALTAIGGSTGIYGLVLLWISGRPGFSAASLFIGIGVAAVWRIVHVNRELKVLKRWIKVRLN